MGVKNECWMDVQKVWSNFISKKFNAENNWWKIGFQNAIKKSKICRGIFHHHLLWFQPCARIVPVCACRVRLVVAVASSSMWCSCLRNESLWMLNTQDPYTIQAKYDFMWMGVAWEFVVAAFKLTRQTYIIQARNDYERMWTACYVYCCHTAQHQSSQQHSFKIKMENHIQIKTNAHQIKRHSHRSNDVIISTSQLIEIPGL